MKHAAVEVGRTSRDVRASTSAPRAPTFRRALRLDMPRHWRALRLDSLGATHPDIGAPCASTHWAPRTPTFRRALRLDMLRRWRALRLETQWAPCTPTWRSRPRCLHRPYCCRPVIIERNC